MAVKPISPLNLDRYELKYRIPLSYVEPISRYVSQYCDMDYYSQISPDGFYMINSLYLDTPMMNVFRAEQANALGYSSFRIRSYGEKPSLPFYVESKQKINDFCKKRRGKIEVESIRDLIERPSELKGFDPYADKNIRDFLEKVETLGLQPAVLTQYRRRAFLSTHDNYARVTMDRDLRFQEETDWNVIPDERQMSHYDHQDTFLDPNSHRNVILELKCERKIPLWMVQLVRNFELTHHRFSKFQTAIIALHERQSFGDRLGVGDMQQLNQL